MTILTKADKEILPMALRQNGGFHIACKWYLREWEPLWYQYLYHQIEVPNTTFLAGIACVSGDTMILHPDGSQTSIEQLSKRHETVDVVSENAGHFIPKKASQPFLKGKADLYKITLQNGYTIKTTLEHRFLTEYGYAALRELHIGSLVGVLPNLDQTIQPLDENHCQEILRDCRDRYSLHSRQYDEQLLRSLGTDPSSFQQQVDEDERIHANLFQGDLLEQLQEYNHRDQQTYHPSSSGLENHEVRLHSLFEYRVSEANLEQSQDQLRQSLLRSLRSSNQMPQDQLCYCQLHQDDFRAMNAEFYPESPTSSFQDACEGKQTFLFQSQDVRRPISTFQVLSEDLRADQRSQKTNPCVSYNTSLKGCIYCSTYVLWTQVAKIEFCGNANFYDTIVPDTNNYVGNGFINHNSGKTTTIGASCLIDCLTIPYFRVLNTSVTAKQAELPFEMVSSWIEGNQRIEHLITNVALRPYPTIEFANGSEWVFRTAGKDAKFIRGMEFDRINYDEAGLDVSGEAMKVLRGRLRGVRPNGTNRTGRLDVTTSPTDSPWLKERFEKGWKKNPVANLRDYFSLRVTTYDNTRLTADMIRLMEAEMSDEMIKVELGAEFPDYGVSMFPLSHINACTDQSLNDAVELALRPEEGGKVLKGYVIDEHPRYGVVKFELPANPRSTYVMAGDPGQDSPPKRNSPVVAVMDVSSKPNKVVYFDWIDGRGSYTPFLQSYKYAMSKYRPVLKGVDTTGTQKAIDELAFENMGLEIDGINFQRDKQAMLNSLSLSVTDHSMAWPVIKGLQRQMTSYSRENDDKIPQDIVMVLAQLAFLARFTNPEENDQQTVSNNYENRYGRTHDRRSRTISRRRR